MKRSFVFLFVLFTLFIFVSCSALFSPVKPLKVGNVVISQIPKEAIIEYIDESYKDRIAELNKDKMLIIFNGYAVAGRISKSSGYEKARMNAQSQIAEYLNNKVEVMKKKVEGYISNLGQNNENVNLEEVSTTAMKSITKVFAESKQFGVKEIAKYYIPKGNTFEYYEVLIYDPSVLINLFETSQLVDKIKNIGGESKEIFDMVNEIFKSAEK